MATTTTPALEDGLLPIAVQTLDTSNGFDFRLYLQSDEDAAPRLYKDRNIPFSTNDLENLMKRGVRVLYVRDDDAAALRDHINNNILTNNSLPLSQRYEILRDSTRSILSNAFERHDGTELTATTGSISRKMIPMICGTQSFLCDLFGVMQHDYSAYSHAMNVCTYSVLLARQLGIRDEQELIQLAQGAMLHDIGKPRPAEGSHEPRRQPSPARRPQQADRTHPLEGFRKFSSNADLTEGQLMMIYQHHERSDAKGFPVGIPGSETHPWSRICAIADTLENFVAAQPGAQQTVDEEAQMHLARQAGTSLDKEMITCWTSALKSDRSLV